MFSTAPKRIAAFDPGGTTGWAFYSDKTIKSGQIDGRHHKELLNHLHYLAPETVVYERFDYRVNKRKAELEAVEYIGILKLYASMTNCPIVPQPQLKDKTSFWDNKKLKVLNLYQVNQPHANDATRQLLHFITSNLKDTYWVEQFGRG